MNMLALMIALLAVPDAPPPLPLLPGQNAIVFTLYGAPGDPESLSSLMDFLEARGLANGFDPGPSSNAASAPLFARIVDRGWPCISYPGFSDFQLKDGRARLTDADEAALRVFDDHDVFHGIQLGEWGYHFHNLSMNTQWFRDVYGDQFDEYKHLIRRPSLKGYDEMPASRPEARAMLKDYWDTRNAAMRGRNISVTGHSHYEGYAGAWGAKLIGLELGENIAYTQSKIAFARGAARTHNLPFSIQVSPWFHGACTTRGPLTGEGGSARGLDAGHSLNFYVRLWLHSWFAGAAMVTPENSANIFFEADGPPWKLTSHGEKAAEVFAFMRAHDRGTPFTPVAIVLDENAGYNAYMRRPWGIFENTPADEKLYTLFQDVLFPGSDHIHQPPNPDNPEASYLRPTPFGEFFDVILSDALPEARERYAVILDTRDNDISPEQLAELVDEHSPVRVTGDKVQYQINRNAGGWVVELINNAGIIKKIDTPVQVDPAAAITVTLTPRVPVTGAEEWRTSARYTADEAREITLTLPPGAVRYVQFTLPNS